METLRDHVLDALQEIGYDALTALEYWNEFKSEVKGLPAGKYTYVIGRTEISFTKQ